MYDTIHFWIHRADISFDPFQIANLLSNVVKSSSDNGYSFTGRLNNFIVKATEAGISVKGSLSKFYFGNNIQTLTLQDTQKAIQMLSERLQISLFQAKVTRIDIGAVLITKHAPASYFKFLGNKARFERVLKTKNSLCYETIKRILAFYDKTLETNKSGMNIPDEFKESNLLRYELRFTQRIPNQLNEKEVNGETLCKPIFYSKLIKLWKDEYKSIQKASSLNCPDYTKIKTPSDAKEAILGYLLHDKDISFVNYFIADLKANKTFNDPKYYSRFFSDISNLFYNQSSFNDEFIIELDNIISNFNRIKYY